MSAISWTLLALLPVVFAAGRIVQMRRDILDELRPARGCLPPGETMRNCTLAVSINTEAREWGATSDEISRMPQVTEVLADPNDGMLSVLATCEDLGDLNMLQLKINETPGVTGSVLTNASRG